MSVDYKKSKMAEYIDREKLIQDFLSCGANFVYGESCGAIISRIKLQPVADVAPVVHGTPMLNYRPKRYERYVESGLNDNGEMLYIKRVYVDEKNYAMYCPFCGKRLCSRFISFCPNCGAKMDGGETNENQT